MARKFLICFSLANLCFVDVWAYLESRFLAYFETPKASAPGLSLLAALLVDILILATVLFAGWMALERLRNAWAERIAGAVFLLMLVIPLNILRTRYHLVGFEELAASYGRTAARLAILAGMVLAAGVLWKWSRRIVAGLQTVVLLLLPVLPLLAIESLYVALRPIRADAAAAGRAPLLAAAPGQARAVWVIFDEMDQYLTFENRPASVQLPEFDRLRREAFYATAASRPGRDTLDAIPALTVGRAVGDLDVVPPSDLRLTFCGERHAVRWSETETIFSSARADGLNTAVVGWYHPYCRVLGSSLTYCYARPADSQFVGEDRSRAMGFRQAMGAGFLGRLKVVPGVIHFGLVKEPDVTAEPAYRRLMREGARAEYQDIHRAALAAIVNPDFGLVYIHWPIPHLPGIYDRRTGQLSIEDGRNYLDNLALADRTLGEMRRALEAAGLWDRTALLVSADHSLRVNLLHGESTWTAEEKDATGDVERNLVVYLLKLPGAEHDGLVYGNPFHATLSAKLLRTVLRKEVSTPRDAALWLDRNRLVSPTCMVPR